MWILDSWNNPKAVLVKKSCSKTLPHFKYHPYQM